MPGIFLLEVFIEVGLYILSFFIVFSSHRHQRQNTNIPPTIDIANPPIVPAASGNQNASLNDDGSHLKNTLDTSISRIKKY